MGEQANRRREPQNRQMRRESTDQAMRQLLLSLAQVAMSLTMIPVKMLPEEPRRHVTIAARELTRGVAALSREFADNLDRIADENQSDEETDLIDGEAHGRRGI